MAEYGPLSGILHGYHLRVRAVRRHVQAEGYEDHVPTMTILTSYDRTEHPWLHGRRPHDLVERLREFLDAR